MPFSEEVFTGVTAVFTVVATVIAWYKNNDITDEAKAGTERMRELKEQRKQGK